MRRRRLRDGTSAGLTLMEIVVAIGLIAVVTLLVVGTLARLLNTGGKTAHQVAGRLLAQEILETSAAAGPPRWGFPAGVGNRRGERSLLLPGDQAETRFFYKLDALRLRKSPQDLGTMTELVVTVWWWGDEPSARAELGNSSLSLARTVYIRGETGP